ncbi:MAG: hypothetical protein ACRDTZ_01910 [Pseudonocardiaceae bacterium]
MTHPFISGRLPNEAEIAEGVAADTTMWALVHLAAGVGSALIAIAFLAVRSYLQEAGENRHSARGLPFVVMGSTLFAVLPGMEFAPLAAAESGATTAEIEAAQAAIGSWFMLVLVVGALTFAAGALLFATAIWQTRVAGSGLTTVVVAALVVMAVTRFVPLSIAQFYVHSLAALLALWPLAYLMWTRPLEQAQPPAAISTA